MADKPSSQTTVTDSEIALIKRRREQVNEAARAVVRRAGVKIDPPIAAARIARYFPEGP